MCTCICMCGLFCEPKRYAMYLVSLIYACVRAYSLSILKCIHRQFRMFRSSPVGSAAIGSLECIIQCMLPAFVCVRTYCRIQLSLILPQLY